MGHQELSRRPLREFGQGPCSCCICSNRHGLTHICSLNMCHQCFHQYVINIGFITLD
ncbi:40S ribosomal protein S29-like [Lontra canadensis]|uniref:40S ribosomal protein S29-like n=1 Tax=Lontra canadensis TaxID=76717 RepID=UPI0013F31255|nr:40S ribosomal protein S29-like [Lontra canadensis]